ncbi:hypothetical protein GE061_016094 [Apolygus lucorum]|uniref:Protein takeout n=1 Tax=Apolygus lucorum TaxID=248454 RepID=A0A6A4K0F9_APOLU|nr:hypothetical protein GE061_016094 [Apolygus lucorum]
MKTSYKILLFCASLAVTIIAFTPQYYLWPPTLMRCSRRDPELDKCLLKATEFAISKIAKGFSMVGLNSLDPLRNAKLTLANDRWPVSLALEADHISIIGPSNVHIRSVSFDERTSIYTMQGFHQSLRVVGNYRVRGSILLFPLNSAGTFDMELSGTLANHTMKLTGNVRDSTHGQVGVKLLSLNNVRVSLRDPSLGTPANRAINRLVNDNWKIVSRALTASMERSIHDIYTAALNPFTSKYTIYDFFPDFGDQVNVDYEQDEDNEETEESGQPVVSYTYFQQWK